MIWFLDCKSLGSLYGEGHCSFCLSSFSSSPLVGGEQLPQTHLQKWIWPQSEENLPGCSQRNWDVVHFCGSLLMKRGAVGFYITSGWALKKNKTKRLPLHSSRESGIMVFCFLLPVAQTQVKRSDSALKCFRREPSEVTCKAFFRKMRIQMI